MGRGALAQGVRFSVIAAGLGLAAAGGSIAMRASAAAPGPVCKVKTGQPVAVTEVLDGGAVILADGRKLLLSGIEAPRGNAKESSAPYASEARAALAALVQGKTLTLSDAGNVSKSGWTRAQAFVDGNWVQGALISGGFARVRTFADRRECGRELLRREAVAREAKRGIWGLKSYVVLTPSTAAQAKGRYGLVEGDVESTANIGGRIFLNFGPDFRTDFTVQVKPENVQSFVQAGIDLNNLKGKRLRVRGYVREKNGPIIDVATPEQVEVLP